MNTQPVAGSQVSTVQGSPSSQVIVVFEHSAVAGSQVSVVQALLSSQLFWLHEQPFTSTGSPSGVFGHRSVLSGTPSWSESPPGIHEYQIAGNGAVDILAEQHGQRLVVEIETGRSDVSEKARKCLVAGFDKVIIAATNPDAHARIARWLASEAPAEERLELVLCPRRF